MPLQSDIAEQLFMGISMSGVGYLGGFGTSHGLKYSERLNDFIRRAFGLRERTDNSLLELWKELQSRGYTLEKLYWEISASSVGVAEWAPHEFEAVVRTMLAEKVNRDIEGVCDCHWALIQHLEPGDVIVNFNWDTIASDALYHHCRLWFPATGFGVSAGVLAKYPSDAFAGTSHVTLLHPHGATCLYTPIDPDGSERRKVIYVPPETYDSGSSRFDTTRMPDHDYPGGGQLRPETTEESTRFQRGWIHLLSGEWLKPLFVPPSSEKQEYKHWYHGTIRRTMHQLFPRFRRFVLVGYSIPDADLPHLRALFVPEVMRDDADLVVVNPANLDDGFRGRVSQMFPNCTQVDYGMTDFVEFCGSLLGQDDRREFQKQRSDRLGELSRVDRADRRR